jgi:hypothetical protein
VQNDDGSFGAYELTRSYEWLEVSFDRHIGICYCFSKKKLKKQFSFSMCEEETIYLIYLIKSIYNSC